MSIDVTELDQLAHDMIREAERVGHQAAEITTRHAEMVAAGMRSRVNRVSGDTQDSISVDVYGGGGKSGATAVIGPETYYAYFLEHGTVKMPPHPFAQPAQDEVAPLYERALEDLAGSTFQ